MNFYGIPKLDLEFLCSDLKNMFLVAITGLLPGESPYTHNYYVLWFVNVEPAILSPAFPTQLITKCRCVEISGHEVLMHRERSQQTEIWRRNWLWTGQSSEFLPGSSMACSKTLECIEYSPEHHDDVALLCLSNPSSFILQNRKDAQSAQLHTVAPDCFGSQAPPLAKLWLNDWCREPTRPKRQSRSRCPKVVLLLAVSIELTMCRNTVKDHLVHYMKKRLWNKCWVRQIRLES